GWFHTGDLLRVDDDGFWYVSGRLKDRIRVRGELVNPDELEMIINSCNVVKQSGAIGNPIETGEDEIVLFVVPSGSELNRPVLEQFIENNLPKFMRPEIVIEMSELPATSTGKIRRSELREIYNE